MMMVRKREGSGKGVGGESMINFVKPHFHQFAGCCNNNNTLSSQRYCRSTVIASKNDPPLSSIL